MPAGITTVRRGWRAIAIVAAIGKGTILRKKSNPETVAHRRAGRHGLAANCLANVHRISSGESSSSGAACTKSLNVSAVGNAAVHLLAGGEPGRRCSGSQARCADPSGECFPVVYAILIGAIMSDADRVC